MRLSFFLVQLLNHKIPPIKFHSAIVVGPPLAAVPSRASGTSASLVASSAARFASGARALADLPWRVSRDLRSRPSGSREPSQGPTALLHLASSASMSFRAPPNDNKVSTCHALLRNDRVFR